MAVHDLRAMTWSAFAALDRGNVVAVLPLGAIEAHGPHLPLGTDIVIAEAMAQAGAERLSDQGYDVVVLPAIPVAPAPFAAAFDGTLDTSADATTAIIVGIANSLARAGVRTLAIANAHHDPAHVAAIRAAVGKSAAGAARIVFPDLTRRKWAERLTDEFRSGACHAGRYEGSIVLASAPALVDQARLATLPANPKSLVDAIRRGDTTFAEAGGPEAYFGWPSEATADEGRQIIGRLGDLLSEAVLEARSAERAPTEDLSTENLSAEDTEDTEGTQGAGDSEGTGRTERAGREAPRVLPLNPDRLGRAVGFSRGMLVPAGARLLFVAGQTATDATGVVTSRDFVEQFRIALERVVAVVRAAGGAAGDIARMTIYVNDLDVYRAARPQLGVTWESLMERHYPALALVEVTGLVDREALVEIEADAILPSTAVDKPQANGR